jgi:hypothetical protein
MYFLLLISTIYTIYIHMIEDRVAPKPFWFITTSPRPHQHGNCLVGIAHFETDPFGGLASAKKTKTTM